MRFILGLVDGAHVVRHVGKLRANVDLQPLIRNILHVRGGGTTLIPRSRAMPEDMVRAERVREIDCVNNRVADVVAEIGQRIVSEKVVVCEVLVLYCSDCWCLFVSRFHRYIVGSVSVAGCLGGGGDGGQHKRVRGVHFGFIRILAFFGDRFERVGTQVSQVAQGDLSH